MIDRIKIDRLYTAYNELGFRVCTTSKPILVFDVQDIAVENEKHDDKKVTILNLYIKPTPETFPKQLMYGLTFVVDHAKLLETLGRSKGADEAILNVVVSSFGTSSFLLTGTITDTGDMLDLYTRYFSNIIEKYEPASKRRYLNNFIDTEDSMYMSECIYEIERWLVEKRQKIAPNDNIYTVLDSFKDNMDRVSVEHMKLPIEVGDGIRLKTSSSVVGDDYHLLRTITACYHSINANAKVLEYDHKAEVGGYSKILSDHKLPIDTDDVSCLDPLVIKDIDDGYIWIPDTLIAAVYYKDTFEEKYYVTT